MKKISICMGSSCFARGNQRNLEVIEQYQQAHQLEIELRGCRCEGECCSGPNIRIDGKLFSGIDEGTLIDLLSGY